MGNSKSKIKSSSRKKSGRKSKRNESYENLENFVDRANESDLELISLRRTIEANPEMFILNNLMMCVQFFGNYEQDIKHMKDTVVSKDEVELNKFIPPQKRVLLPDVLQAHISKHVGFTSTRQTFRPTIEPLHPVRIYMVHDNIDITEQHSAFYSHVNNSTMYNILLKPTEHQGYVQLQDLNEFAITRKSRRESDMDLSSMAENVDELYSGIDSIYASGKSKSIRSIYSIISEKSKRSGFKESMYRMRFSLPNLYEETLDEFEESENHEDSSRADRNNMNGDIGYDNRYSLEKQRHPKTSVESKGGYYPGGEKETRRTKIQDHPGSNSSGYRTDNYATGSDSSCIPSHSSRFSQSINSDKIDESFIENAELPLRCFKRVTYTADGKIYNPKEERMYLLNSKQRRIKEALRRHNYDVSYISSTEFMKHFIKLFEQRLAKSLSFDQDSLDDLRREGCVLYCDKIAVSKAYKYSRVEQYEIVPAICLEWPICAQEWLDRPRNSWPVPNDVDKVKDLGAYVVPEGFVPKNGNSNIMEDFEWQLTFPTAERYLETCMSQAQVNVYLIALIIHKTFMRPIFDTMFGLTTAHIKHRLFWMIEEDGRPSKWPDSGMGTCLLKLLYSLYYSISRNEPTLRDYFIKDRNLFQRIPCEHLLHTQKQLKRIIENPVIYVFHAMENIRYRNNFFPRLNFEMLLKILTGNIIELINPMLTRNLSRSGDRAREPQLGQNNKYDRTGFWDAMKAQSRKQPDKTLINPFKATDSIIEISTRCLPLDDTRLPILLGFFIEHFIQIGEYCNKYEAYRQKTMYLDHAERLSILLFEHPSYRSDARFFRDRITVLRKKSTFLDTQEVDKSNSSARNTKTAIYVGALNERFTGESRKPDDSLTNSSAPPENLTNDAIVHDGYYEEMRESKVTVVENNDETSRIAQNLADASSTIESRASKSDSGAKKKKKKKELVLSFRDKLNEPESTDI